MIYRCLILILLASSSHASVLRGNNKLVEEQKVRIENPLNLRSNFTADIYTKEKKKYCVYFKESSIRESTNPTINLHYSYFLERDVIKKSSCFDFDLLHPFIIKNKDAYVEADYVYENNTYRYRVDFKIHENNVACFTLTIIYSIIVYPCFFVYILWKYCDETEEALKDYGCIITFIVLFIFMLCYSFGVGLVVIVIPAIIFPYSFLAIGVISFYFMTLLCPQAVNENVVDLDVVLSHNHKHYQTTIKEKEYNKLVEEKDTIIVDRTNKVSARIGFDEITVIKTYNPFQIYMYWRFGCPICACFFAFAIFMGYAEIFKVISEASRVVLLVLEYHTMVIICYGSIYIVGATLYSMKNCCS